MKNKIIKILAIPSIIFILTGVSAFAAENIILPANTPPIALTSGEGFKEVDVTLVAADAVTNLKLTLEQPTGIAATAAPIELQNIKYEITKDALAKDESLTFKIQVKTASAARDGIYTIPLKISYDGSLPTNEEQLFFKVTVPVKTPDEPEISSIVIKSFRLAEDYQDKTINPGEEFMVTVMIQNKGNTLLEDVKISMKNLTPDTFMPIAAGGEVFTDIAPNDKSAASFMLTSSRNLKGGKHLLTVRVDYRDHNNILRFEEGQMFVTIAGDEKPDSEFSTPLILIDNYSYGGESVVGGQTFNLSLNFINTNKLSAVENLKITLSDPNNIYVPKKSSNTLYIEKVEAGAKFNQTILMQSDLTAQPKSYQINVRYEYETVINDRRITATNDENISIPLTQKEYLSVDELIVPNEVLINTPTPIAATFINKGKTDLTNLTVSLESNFKGGSQPYYVGTLAPGRSDSYDANLNIAETGEKTAYLIFTYDSFDGETKEYRQEISVSAVEKLSNKKESTKPVFAMADASTNAKAAEKDNISLLDKVRERVNLAQLIGVLILLAVVALFYYTKKRTKKL